MKPARTLLAAALALAAMPALAQDTYSQTIFFGDSLTDSGTFRPTLIQVAGPSAAILGRFTTNPGLVWAEYVADFYKAGATPSNQGGTNYAVGGARTGVNSVGALGPIPSLSTQITTYLNANGGRADANALYTVWGGANDLFAITNAGAPVAATLGGAVASQVQNVGRLAAAGAQYIIVPTVPDLGLTPAFRAQGAAAAGQGTALSSSYNASVFSSLASAGLRVIPLDTFNLLREVSANPAPFGITNITGTACQPQIISNSLTCNPGTFAAPNADRTFAFADGVHPSSAAHQIIGDLALSVLEAPAQIAVLPYSASITGRARIDRVAAHLDGAPEGEGMRFWGDVRGDYQRARPDDHLVYDGGGGAVTIGADWTAGNTVFGAFGGYGLQNMDWRGNRGDFDQNDATLGGFVGYYGDNFWVNGQLSYTWLDYETNRRVKLGVTSRTHRGETEGTNLAAAIDAGYEFGAGNLRYGPVVSLRTQRIEVDGFAESDAALSSSLAYPDQEFDSMVGSAGFQLRMVGSDTLAPYARFTVDREFEEQEQFAFARAQSIAGTGFYATPGQDFDQSYGTATVGARLDLFGFDANIGTALTFGKDDGGDTTVFATFGNKF